MTLTDQRPTQRYAIQPDRNTPALTLAIIVALLLVALSATVAIAVGQHGKAIDTAADLKATEATLADTKADLKQSQADLADAQFDLSNAQSSLTDSEAKVTACGYVSQITTHLTTALNEALASGTASIHDNFRLSLNHLDLVDADLAEIDRILTESGHTKDFDALQAECTGAGAANS